MSHCVDAPIDSVELRDAGAMLNRAPSQTDLLHLPVRDNPMLLRGEFRNRTGTWAL